MGGDVEKAVVKAACLYVNEGASSDRNVQEWKEELKAQVPFLMWDDPTLDESLTKAATALTTFQRNPQAARLYIQKCKPFKPF